MCRPQAVTSAISEHYSLAKDGCMPTTTSSAVAATTADTADLFGKYLTRFCYACDTSTCP